MAQIEQFARRERLTVGAWVRRALREVYERKPVNDTENKLKAIHRAAQYSFPTADPKEMLREIEQGYER